MPDLPSLTRAELDALDRAAQAVIDSNTPPTAAQRAYAYATIEACRNERKERDDAYDSAAQAYCRGDRSPLVVATVQAGRR